MTSFPLPDSNVWYQITNSAQGFNSSLQYNGYIIWLSGGEVNDFWQFFPSSNGTYQIRNQQATQQLTACYKPEEPAAGNTQPCMMATTNDTTQEWSLSGWVDGTLKISNVYNGTGYNLDCHPGRSMYMSSSVAEDPVQPDQHWEIKSLSDINDGAFSTAFPKAIVTTSTTSSISVNRTSNPTASISAPVSFIPTSTTSSTSPPLSSKIHGLSTAAAAGIDISIGVAVLLISALLFLIYRHRQRKRFILLPISELHGDGEFRGGSRGGLHEAPHAEPSEMYSPPAELPVAVKQENSNKLPDIGFQIHHSVDQG